MTGRPDGVTNKMHFGNALLTSIAGRQYGRHITEKIRGHTGLGEADAARPSAHLRFALQQLKLRGWSNEQWGKLLEQDGSMGTGPVCILESVGSVTDAPGGLRFETPEQHYVRFAFVTLGYDPVPLYISVWNDEVASFEEVERVLTKAAELAETDERVRFHRWAGLSEEQLRAYFGITEEALDAASDKLEQELAGDPPPKAP